MTVSVRIAPSPTGLLHIGNIRAALFNYLFARKHGGTFMLRLDDTDQVRSTAAFAEAIDRDLKWLGLNWDKFARQCDRLERYRGALFELQKSGRVYPCFETQGELDLKRKTQLGRGLPPVYDRAALKLSDSDKEKLKAEGRKPHWRFKLDAGDVNWNDVVQGTKHFPSSSLSDPVLVREDGVPLYTFCSVVDDVDFSVSHIIRGEDHVTNTAVQIQIWKAITQADPPIFAHFPLIVSAQGIEMSKRLGTLSIASMRDEMGIEPMAINSLLAKLGTSEAVTPRTRLDDLVDGFDLTKISRATPKFDLHDLETLNAKIFHMTAYSEVKDRLTTLGHGAIGEEFWNMARANISKLSDVTMWWNVAHGPITPTITESDFLTAAQAVLPPSPWNADTWESWISRIKIETGRKGKELFQPLRLALTGSEHGPEMKLLLPIIGPERASRLLKGQSA